MKQNNNKKVNKGKNTTALSVAMAVLVALMMGVFPLFYTNNYINIIQAKRSFFEITGWSMIVICLVIIIVLGLEMQVVKDVLNKLDTGHKICLCLFASGLFVSTCVSDDIANTVFAPDGRRYGLTVVALCLILYVLVATYFKCETWLIWVIIACNDFMSVLIVEDNWKRDLLGMKLNLVETQYSKFTGTMGNINVNASYLAIIIPLMIGLFYSARKIKLSIFLQTMLGISIFLTTSAGLCIRSDSIIWCIFLVIAIVWYYALVYGNTFDSYLRMAIINGCIAIAYTVIGLAYVYDKSESYGFSSLGEFVCTGKGLIFLWVMFAIAILLVIFKAVFKNLNLKLLARAILVFFIACTLFGIVMLIISNFIVPESGNSFIRRFYISDSFGSNRGYVWRRTLRMIKADGFINFICGYGLNRFYIPFYSFCYDEMMSRFSAPFIDAHNEALQMLVTTGILGAAGYIGMLVSSVVHGIKNAVKSPIYLVEVAVFASYILQGLVNNPQVFTLPVIFIVMGITNSVKEE